MKKGYLVGYSFNRYNTLTNYAFLVQTSDKRLAQYIAKNGVPSIKKSGMCIGIEELLLARLPKRTCRNMETILAMNCRGI